MSKYKQSFYNIDLVKEGYVEKMENVNPVYNTLRGKFGYIPSNLDLDNPPEQLLKEGFIVPSALDEPMQYKQNQIKAIENEYPKSIKLSILTSTRCNYHCEYCFEGDRTCGIDLKGEILQDTIQYIKKEIDRNSNLEHFHIQWFGGEPLMNMQAIREISKFVIPYCLDKGIKYDASIITNGYFMTKEISKELKDLCVTQAQIAIDGFEDNYIAIRKAPKDAFKRVLKNISDSSILVMIRLNTTRHNKGEIIELVKDLMKFTERLNNKVLISVCRVKDYSNKLQYGFTDREWLDFRTREQELFENKNNKKVRLDGFHLIPCFHNQVRNVSIGPDGNLYRCDYYVNNPTKAIGTLKDGLNYGNEIDAKFVCSTITEHCLKCKYLPVCAGGLCRYAELKRGKDCELIKGRFKQNMTNYLKYVNPM